MLGIDKMSSKQIHEILSYVKYAHLDCVHQGKHYVMSVEYYIADSDIYLFSAESTGTKDIGSNPKVCLQAEDVYGLLHWHRAIINGQASRLTDPADIDRVIHFIEKYTSLLSPAINRTLMDALRCSELMAIYHVQISDMSWRTI
jgi:uncharacterized protein